MKAVKPPSPTVEQKVFASMAPQLSFLADPTVGFDEMLKKTVDFSDRLRAATQAAQQAA